MRPPEQSHISFIFFEYFKYPVYLIQHTIAFLEQGAYARVVENDLLSCAVRLICDLFPFLRHLEIASLKVLHPLDLRGTAAIYLLFPIAPGFLSCILRHDIDIDLSPFRGLHYDLMGIYHAGNSHKMLYAFNSFLI